METLLWELLGIASLFGFAFALNHLNDKFSFRWLIIIIMAIVGFTFALVFLGQSIAKVSPPCIHSKDFQIKTEIRVETVNGLETLIDTIYVFTLKQ